MAADEKQKAASRARPRALLGLGEEARMERGNNTLVRVCMIAFGQRWVNRAITRLKNRLAQALVRTALQEVLEAEMTEALGAVFDLCRARPQGDTSDPHCFRARRRSCRPGARQEPRTTRCEHYRADDAIDRAQYHAIANIEGDTAASVEVRRVVEPLDGLASESGETFFKTLKSELVWTIFYTRQQATQAIGRYIDGFYNPVRRHSALDFASPAQFEKMASE